MTASIIDGKAYAAGLRARVAQGVAGLKAGKGITPGLAVVLVGDDPASQVYVRSKTRLVAEAGMTGFDHRLPANTPQADLLALVARLNADPAVHGILVQLPLPAHIDSAHVIAAIDPAKDVDGLSATNAGRLVQAGSGPLDFPVACTPLGCLMLLKDSLGSLAGADAVVVGRSVLVGKPMAQLLVREDCTVTLAHSRTRDLPGLCRRADILVAATGRAQMVKGDWVKPGATVIDVGITRVDRPDGKQRLIGDVDFEAASAVARAITPVPGGIGPMTIACLLHNTLQAARRAAGLGPAAI
ncbi:bifunctional methylenetetrahydrofolate dehydrogenase/methenyltetrahydrofolate cyclohydrolase FolD [Vineibacter terrae]|uniref:Bifunctional protein FolD n=1 Tax=Vineibacter terrae TaxID=2586908 RepID=A0A5C8PN98_9HYPH|nr:bifunctional methylenetetrahydrofolate dehydrogenase/methenyltetrahydrofolate cyclohydrolase FolD [Vineibacter terrae]TXL76042.1 bifunctional methylenetetrahydrofolate dehydrogenase/methenyltetrahydrofolate cyclohydrolase FolD [Vineibacter terrae]